MSSDCEAPAFADLGHCFSSLAIELAAEAAKMRGNDDLLVSFSGIERDAVTIFTRFVSPDAVRPIPITEQIRNDIVGKRLLPVCCRGFFFFF